MQYPTTLLQKLCRYFFLIIILYSFKCVNLQISNNLRSGCVHSKVAVLFSGGLDSAVVAVLAHFCIPIQHSIDLINVAFTYANNSPSSSVKILSCDKNFLTPDRITGLATFSELVSLFPDRNWNFIEVSFVCKKN